MPYEFDSVLGSKRGGREIVLNKNEFGKLVKVYRKQRGWTQEELADHWGHTSSYVSQIEGGRRKLDSVSQVMRLADILDIPQEKLEEIGRGIPERKSQVHTPAQADNAILQMLLAPSRDMVKLSWLTWFANAAPSMEDHLQKLSVNLDTALASYRGEFVKPAQQLLAYAHQMRGKIAFDKLDYIVASSHFSEMIALGEELHDSDIIASGMIHQGDVFRKRGRYETAIRCFEAAQPFANAAVPGIQGMRYQIMARAYAAHGDEQRFLRTIQAALEIAEHTQDTIDNLANQFNLVECLQEQAQGFTILWKPEKALEIYKETDQLRPTRLLRDLGSYTIVKAQAYAYVGDLDLGMEYSLRGLQLASQYRSKRHIARIENMYNRLSVTKLGQDKKLHMIHDALIEAQKKQAVW
jgi:transcriptional regulator with XRE-family HTH domain